MTGALLARIWVFVVAAFGLGLLVGWMFWRFHRSSMPSDRWRAEQADLLAQRRRADQLAADRDALIEHVTRVRSEASRLAVLLTARRGRTVRRCGARRPSSRRRSARLRADLQQADARARYLERRATERAVGGGARPGVGNGDGARAAGRRAR